MMFNNSCDENLIFLVVNIIPLAEIFAVVPFVLLIHFHCHFDTYIVVAFALSEHHVVNS
jgi:hypothetical protein